MGLPSMVGIRVTHTGGVSIVRRARAMSGRAVDLAPAFEVIAKDMQRIEGQVFQSQGRRGGGSWTYLAQETLKRRRRQGIQSKLILHATGRLIRSLSEEGGEHIQEITPSTMRFGSDVPYAAIQNWGGGHIPARPFLRYTPYDHARWRAIIGRWIKSGTL